MESHQKKGVYNEQASYFQRGKLQSNRSLFRNIEKPKLLLEYKDKKLKQTYEPDFISFDKIILEIKAVKKLTDEHRAQIINYLKSTGMNLGLLVNFGSFPKIEYERFINE